MTKTAVVYWSGTGNTQAMAQAVADGINEKGGEAVICNDFPDDEALSLCKELGSALA